MLSRVAGSRVIGARASDRAFLGIAVLVFAASAATTIVWCSSMPAMEEMSMPGGWTMSMLWMRAPGQTWSGAAATFLAMWMVMMLAMMLPSLVPMLERYRKAIAASAGTRRDPLTLLVGVGYLVVWAVLGLIVFALGTSLAEVAMEEPALARAAPLVAGTVLLLAGTFQFTAWKTRRLACCRGAPWRGHALPADAGTAWRHGVRLGLHCSACCASLMAILLVLGVMNLYAMVAVTAAITAERLAPRGGRVARAIGAVVLAGGALLVARAAGV